MYSVTINSTQKPDKISVPCGTRRVHVFVNGEKKEVGFDDISDPRTVDAVFNSFTAEVVFNKHLPEDCTITIYAS